MRQPYDHYETPSGVCYQALSTVGLRTPNSMVLDPCAGDNGVWGYCARLLWPGSHITGVEIREVEPHSSYDHWVRGDFLSADLPSATFDLVCGNYPFSLAEEFILKGLSLLKEDGIMVALLRLSFLESEKRRRGLWKQHPPSHIFVLSRRPRFTTYNNYMSFGVYLWEKDLENGPTTLSWL